MKLIFVYNANGGLLNTAKDIGHKLLSPQTYDCFLCSLTHGTFRELSEWKDFRQNSSVDMEFFHRDDFEKEYDKHFEYPVVLNNADSLEVVISRERLGEFSSLEDLIGAVKELTQQT